MVLAQFRLSHRDSMGGVFHFIPADFTSKKISQVPTLYWSTWEPGQEQYNTADVLGLYIFHMTHNDYGQFPFSPPPPLSSLLPH